MALFQELQRRKVFRVAIAYAIMAWLVMQIGDTMVPALHLPEWSSSLLAFFLILGFPVAMFFAWAFELTPDGLRRETEMVQQKSNRTLMGEKLNRTIFIVMILALGYFALDKFVFTTTSEIRPGVSTIIESDRNIPANAAIVHKSIAVLPFVNMSSDQEQEYFSDGLTEELLNLLAGIKELKVAARTSSFFYKDKLDTIPLKEIARQLQVTHLLEGSVRKSGNTIRITAQLINADTGFHLWSETYDRQLDDIFAIQDEIAAAVTESLRITLLGEIPKAKVLDSKSFELTLQGRYLFNRRNEGDLQRALELFEHATELDSNNAAAWVGMSPLYIWLFDPPDLARARSAVEKALQLEPDNPEAHIRMGRVLFREGKRQESMASYDHALELGPDNPLVLSVFAGLMLFSGELETAIEFSKRALAADPLHVTNLSNIAGFLIQLNRVDEAEIYALKAMDLAPLSPASLTKLAVIRLLQGHPEETIELVSTLGGAQVAAYGGDRKLFLTAMAQFTIGSLQASNRALEAYRQDYGEENPSEMAKLHAWRGEVDQAFEWIDKVFIADPNLSKPWFDHPFLYNLHDDPRWVDLMARWPGQEVN